MTVHEAINAAMDDLRHAAALLLRPTRTQSVALDSLTGGAVCLAPDVHPDVQHAYGAAIERGVARLPGIARKGDRLVRS